jgi:hypothetical protein
LCKAYSNQLVIHGQQKKESAADPSRFSKRFHMIENEKLTVLSFFFPMKNIDLLLSRDDDGITVAL